MRNFARVPNAAGQLVWTVVETDANGNNDLVYLMNLFQVLRLNLNESPFWANFGLPAAQSVVQQVWPDFYVAMVQQQFAPYFASLMISKVASAAKPTYNVAVVTHQGANLSVSLNTASGALATESGSLILTESGQFIQV